MWKTILGFFEKFPEISPTVWGVLIALVLVAVLIYFATRSRKMWTTRMIVFAALSMALAFVLSYIRIIHMPQGGSLTPGSMLPVMLFAYTFGTIPGLVVGAAYGLLQLLQDLYVVHPVQLLLDYVLAFGALGLAGLFRKQNILWLGVLVAGFTRFLCSYISGVVFFASYAPEGQAVWIYSLVYNGSIIGGDTLICLVIALIPALKNVVDRLKNQMLTTH
jgi:thiamine transporter